VEGRQEHPTAEAHALAVADGDTVARGGGRTMKMRYGYKASA